MNGVSQWQMKNMKNYYNLYETEMFEKIKYSKNRLIDINPNYEVKKLEELLDIIYMIQDFEEHIEYEKSIK